MENRRRSPRMRQRRQGDMMGWFRALSLTRRAAPGSSFSRRHARLDPHHHHHLSPLELPQSSPLDIAARWTLPFFVEYIHDLRPRAATYTHEAAASITTSYILVGQQHRENPARHLIFLPTPRDKAARSPPLPQTCESRVQSLTGAGRERPPDNLPPRSTASPSRQTLQAIKHITR